MRIRYLLDEDTPRAIRDQLLRLRPDMEILAVGDEGAPPFGTPDAELLRWVEKEGCILVSRNRRTMPNHLHHHLEAGRHVPGILLLRPRYSVGEVIEDLHLIWEVAELREYQDQILYLPL